MVALVGMALQVSRFEWCWLLLAIAAVFAAEALNTAVEFLADAISREYHPLLKQAKDVAAGAVLIAALAAVLIGVLILGPHLLEIIR